MRAAFRHLGLLGAIHLLLFACILLGAACTKETRSTTLHAAVLATDGAHEGFMAFDEVKIRQIANDCPPAEGRAACDAKLQAYYAKVDRVKDGFHLVYRALAVAATQTDELSLNAAMGQLTGLIAAITALKMDASHPEGEDKPEQTAP